MGASFTTNIDQTDQESILLNANECQTYSFSAIYNRFGAYYGSVLYNEKMRKNTDGIHIQGKRKYKEFGILLGLNQYFFLEGGYSLLNTEAALYENETKTKNSSSADYSGINGGIALIFNGFQAEATYNSLFNSFHIGAGLNFSKNMCL